MHGRRIVDAGLDLRRQARTDGVTVGHAYRVDMIDMAVAARRGVGDAERIELGVIAGGRALALPRPVRKVRQLHVQHRRLHLIEAMVEAFDFMDVFARLAPVPQKPQAVRQIGPAGGDSAAFAAGPEVLAGIEAEAAEVAARAGPEAILVSRAVCLGGVLDHHQAVGAGDGADGAHVGQPAVQMHGDDRLGARCDGRLQLGGIHRPGDGIDVDQPRRCVGVLDGRHGGHKGGGRGDDLVARTHAGGEQRQVQRRRSGADGDRFGAAAVVGE
jgi:hypothetical protein